LRQNYRQLQNSARAVLLAAHNRFGTRSFVVDPRGPNHQPLRDAEGFGWCWFEKQRCAITASGLEQIEPYRKAEPKPIVQWICPVCLDVVSQFPDREDLPEMIPCPTCQKNAIEAADHLMQREQECA
jgi:hypothetical protein